MYINNEFTKAITEASPKIAFRMTSEGEVITSIGNGLLLTDTWEFISDSFIGELPIWKMKASFLYQGEKKSYVNKEFLCEVGAYSFSEETGWTENIQWTKVGYFSVPEDGQKTNEITRQIDLTMYDRGIRLNKRYNPLEFPIAGRDLRFQLASRNDIELYALEEVLPYDDVIFHGINVSINEAITDREVLRQYAQLNMSSAFINREGKLEFKSVFSGTVVDAKISNVDYYSTFKKEHIYGPLNSLIYTNKAKDDDQSYQEIETKNEDSIAKYGKKSIEFSNNIFLDSMSLEQQQIEINKLFTIVDGFSYAPFDMEYFARPDLDPYDKIKVSDMEGNESVFPITNMTFDYNGGLIGTLKTKELPETLPKPAIPNIFERVTNAEIRVDRTENKITSVVSDITNTVEQVNIFNDDLTEKIQGAEDQISEQEGQIQDVSKEAAAEVTKVRTELLSSMEQTAEQQELVFRRIESVQDGQEERLNEIATFYRYGIDGAIVGREGDPMQFYFSNDEASFRNNGERISYWRGKKFYVEELEVLASIIIGQHLIESEGNNTKVRSVN